MSSRPVVLVEFSPSGGLFQFGVQLGEALSSEVDDVELWTGPDPELDSRKPNFVIKPVLPTWHPTSGQTNSKVLRIARRVFRAGQLALAWVVLGARVIVKRPRAVLFSNWRFTFEPVFVVLIATLARRTEFGIVAHEPFPRSDARDTSTVKSGKLLDAAFTAAWARMDLVFVLGAKTREQVVERWHPRADVVVIPHGDEGALLPKESRDDWTPASVTGQVVLFFGTWTRYKGIDILLDAFAEVRQRFPNARLVMVGAVGADLDVSGVLSRAAQIGNVDARPGYVESSAVFDIVNAARVVATPYVRASQSGVAHLAFTAGRPVVATDVGDLPDVVIDGDTGLLVSPGDAGALADALAKLLEDAELAQRLGDAGHRKISGAWDRAAELVAETLVKVEGKK